MAVLITCNNAVFVCKPKTDVNRDVPYIVQYFIATNGGKINSYNSANVSSYRREFLDTIMAPDNFRYFIERWQIIVSENIPTGRLVVTEATEVEPVHDEASSGIQTPPPSKLGTATLVKATLVQDTPVQATPVRATPTQATPVQTTRAEVESLVCPPSIHQAPQLNRSYAPASRWGWLWKLLIALVGFCWVFFVPRSWPEYFYYVDITWEGTMHTVLAVAPTVLFCCRTGLDPELPQVLWRIALWYWACFALRYFMMVVVGYTLPCFTNKEAIFVLYISSIVEISGFHVGYYYRNLWQYLC
jgi:hypothetical protein